MMMEILSRGMSFWLVGLNKSNLFKEKFYFSDQTKQTPKTNKKIESLVKIEKKKNKMNSRERKIKS